MIMLTHVQKVVEQSTLLEIESLEVLSGAAAAVVGQLAVAGTVSAALVVISTAGNLIAALFGTMAALRLFNRERLLYSM